MCFCEIELAFDLSPDSLAAKLDPQGNGLAFLVLLSHASINKLRGADVLGKLSLIWFYLQDSPSCHFSLGVWLLIRAHVASHSLIPHRQPTGSSFIFLIILILLTGYGTNMSHLRSSDCDKAVAALIKMPFESRSADLM